MELLVQKCCIVTSVLLLWCPYMVINVSVQYNGGLLPDIILLTLCDSIGEPVWGYPVVGMIYGASRVDP